MHRGQLLLETILSNAYDNSKSRIAVTFILVSVLAAHGLRKRSLSKSGALAAWIIGTITCLSGWVFAISLLSFYQSSSSLTKYKASIKKKIEENHLTGGQRNYIQVLSNSLTGTVFGLIFLLFAFDPNCTFLNSDNKFDTFLICAVIGHYACCNGDTWASELGILNTSQPILITTFKTVPRGTNGGISRNGTLASILGGTFIGVSYYIASNFFNSTTALKSQVPVIFLATFSGLFGSLFDSLLGATLQYSGWNKKKKCVTNNAPDTSNMNDIEHICGIDLLDNHQVNFISSFSTSIITGLIGMYLF